MGLSDPALEGVRKLSIRDVNVARTYKTLVKVGFVSTSNLTVDNPDREVVKVRREPREGYGSLNALKNAGQSTHWASSAQSDGRSHPLRSPCQLHPYPPAQSRRLEICETARLVINVINVLVHCLSLTHQGLWVLL